MLLDVDCQFIYNIYRLFSALGRNDLAENAIEEILRTAILREIEANAMYTAGAKRVQDASIKAMLQELALQELGHQHKLEALLAGDTFKIVSHAQQQKIQDLKITDYLVPVPLAGDATLQDVLIVAGQREKGSHALYLGLAQVAEDEQAVQLFQFLAQEELGHKNRVETLYDEIVYSEN